MSAPASHAHLERVSEPGTVGVWACKCGARGTLAELRAIACTAGPATDDDLITAIEGPTRYVGETCPVPACGPEPVAPCTAQHCYRTVVSAPASQGPGAAVEYRQGLPSVEEVRAHEERGGCWLIRRTADPVAFIARELKIEAMPRGPVAFFRSGPGNGDSYGIGEHEGV